MPTVPAFTREQVEVKAREMGLADGEGDLADQAMRVAHHALATEFIDSLRPTVTVGTTHDLTVTVEVALDGLVVGASVTHVPLSEGPTPR